MQEAADAVRADWAGGGRLGPRIQEGSVSGAPGRRGIPSRVRGACGSPGPAGAHVAGRAGVTRGLGRVGRAAVPQGRRRPAPPLCAASGPGAGAARRVWERGSREKGTSAGARRFPLGGRSARRRAGQEAAGGRGGRAGCASPRGGGAAARAPGVPAEGLQARAPASVSRFDMTGATFGKSHGTATHRGGDSGEASPQMRKLRHRVERLAQGHTAGR